MLDQVDHQKLETLSRRALTTGGLFFVLGPADLFSAAISKLEELFTSAGAPPGHVVDLALLSANELSDLARHPPSARLYFSGTPSSAVLNRLDVLREAFVRSGTSLIFLLTPADYRRFRSKAGALGSAAVGFCPLSSQRILDDMGEPFQERLLEVLGTIDDYERQLNSVVGQSPASRPDALVVLQRWNSFSPGLPRHLAPTGESEAAMIRRLRREIRGGGYLVRWQGYGMVIDPGHNFIENLYESGYSIADVDAVIISHDHLDHTADFELILDLIYQYNKRARPAAPKKLSVYLNPTTFTKYQKTLRRDRLIRTVVELQPSGLTFRKPNKTIQIRSLHAQHVELGGQKNAVSLRLELRAPGSGPHRKLSVGFTCDTGWNPTLAPFFEGVDVLVPHLGSIKRYELEQARFYPTHLGVLGLFKLLEEMEQRGCCPTVVVSEFGEELKGLRDVLARELGDRFPKMKVFPGDIGHTIELLAGGIRVVCHHESTCSSDATGFFEEEGRIQLRCRRHLPSWGAIGRP